MAAPDQPHLTCFGVADGWPSPDRRHAAFLYDFTETAALVDCGDGFSSAYAQSGLDYDLIRAVFLSHLHFDHVGGFFMLMQSFWLKNRRRPLPVYLPKEGLEAIARMIQASYLFPEALNFPLQFEALVAGAPISLSGVTATPFLTSHLDGTKRAFSAKYSAEYHAYCFLFETAGGLRLGHSGDIGRAEDLLPLLEKPLDLLVCETAHVRPEELFDFLKSKSIRRIVFVHVAGSLWEKLDSLEELAERLLPMPFSFARDGDQFPFSNSRPTPS